jgi:uncharacterized protein (DUF2236 family)
MQKTLASVQSRLFETAGSGQLSYLEPKGDPGFYGPDSMAWRVHANPVALAIGGVAAVILELAEPRVRTGVWEHSSFRSDPLSRMKRTGEAAMITTYGSTAMAHARVDKVTRMHQRVSGATPEGQAYSALEPELMTWVHVTAGYGFLNAYLRYVDPGLRLTDQDRYYAEGAKLGRAFGAVDPPASVAEVETCFQAMRPKLRAHPIIGEFLHIVANTSPLGPAGRPVQTLLAEASIDLLPTWVRDIAQLPSRPLARAVVRPIMKGLARAAGLVPNEIQKQAYARVGRSPP